MTSLSSIHNDVDSGRIRRLLTELQQEAGLFQTRLVVTRLVARDASQWVDDNPASLDLIIDDVLAKWLQQESGNHGPAALEDFWNQYANRVEWAPPDSGNQYRPEFCPANPGEFDCNNYFRAVWTARVADLLARRSTTPHQPSTAAR